jgi:hypothetical protein
MVLGAQPKALPESLNFTVSFWFIGMGQNGDLTFPSWVDLGRAYGVTTFSLHLEPDTRDHSIPPPRRL